jgi:hypothetical protein
LILTKKKLLQSKQDNQVLTQNIETTLLKKIFLVSLDNPFLVYIPDTKD